MAKVVLTGYRMAIDFGANSPKTICKTVITAKDPQNAIVDAMLWYSGPLKPINSKNLMIIGEIELSPTQPKPRDARVIPNWVAAKWASKWFTIVLAVLVSAGLMLDFVSICDMRIFTMANSAATKKAFSKTKKIVSNSFQMENSWSAVLATESDAMYKKGSGSI